MTGFLRVVCKVVLEFMDAGRRPILLVTWCLSTPRIIYVTRRSNLWKYIGERHCCSQRCHSLRQVESHSP